MELIKLEWKCEEVITLTLLDKGIFSSNTIKRDVVPTKYGWWEYASNGYSCTSFDNAIAAFINTGKNSLTIN